MYRDAEEALNMIDKNCTYAALERLLLQGIEKIHYRSHAVVVKESDVRFSLQSNSNHGELGTQEIIGLSVS